MSEQIDKAVSERKPEVKQARKNGRTVMLLAGIVAGMFAFGFALVPLYQLFCDVTGFNGSSQARVSGEAYSGQVDS